MRVKIGGIATVIVATALLAGCSAGETPSNSDEKPAESQASTPAEESSDETAEKSEETTKEEDSSAECPELKEGVSIEIDALTGCISAATQNVAGYAATSTIMGMETTGRVNPAKKEYESLSPAGSIISLDGQGYVKLPTSDWQVADTASSDPMIAALSTSATNMASMDMAAIATNGIDGTVTATGTNTRLDQNVFVFTGTVEQQGVATEVTYELTADYAPFAVLSKSSTEGMDIETSVIITEWDKEQNIVAPL